MKITKPHPIFFSKHCHFQKNQFEKIYVYTSLARLFQKNKEPERAVETIEKALPYFDGLQEQVYSEEKAVIHNNLAALFYEKDLTSSLGTTKKHWVFLTNYAI
ncbi:MAG: hypothetical protein U5K51_11240 [Flavobacteriaceae bacterium]|nr:hypothetical protein [Flavobacteriaceae bacterium]